MKKNLICFLATILVLMSFKVGYCADTTFFGCFDTRFNTNDNLLDAQSNIDDKRSYMDTKLALGIENKFDENLKGVAVFEIGNIIWGLNGETYPVGRGVGGAAGGNAINIETKNIYLDFSFLKEETNIKVGLMPFKIADGFIADDDAFGAAIKIGEGGEFTAAISYIKIYQDSIGVDYYDNTTDSDRREDLFALEISRVIDEDFSVRGLFSGLIDRYNGAETNELNRDIYFVGAGGKKIFGKIAITGDFIQNTGDIVNSEVAGNAHFEEEANGYLLNISGNGDFGALQTGVQFLYASGDDPSTTDKMEGYIAPETAAKMSDTAANNDIAEILSKGELSDGIEGEDAYAAYQYIPKLSNIYVIKGKAEYALNKKTTITGAVIYAALPQEIIINNPVKAHRVGTEFDLKLKRIIYLADDQKKGISFSLIGALLLSGDVFDTYDSATGSIIKGSNIYELGAKLTYEF